MFPYILLLVFAFLFCFIAKATNTGKVIIGNSEYVKKNNLSLFMFFITFFIILAVRDISIGRDLFAYELLFKQYNRMSFFELRKTNEDILYVLMNWGIGRVTDNFRIVIVIISAITLLPIYIQYAKDRKRSFMKVVLFMNMSTFIMFFSGLRQSIAIAIGMIAYEFVKKKKLVWFLIAVFIAIGFHHSAFVLFMMYPIYHWKARKKSLILIIPITVGIYLFNKPIFKFLTTILNQISTEQYDTEISFTGAFTMIILLALFFALSYFLPDERIIDEETIGLRNLLMLALWLQFFALLHNLAMRFNYYYIIFVPMCIPRILESSRIKYKHIAKVVGIVITSYLLYYYLNHTYEACITGKSALDTYPYIPFWSK